MLIRIVRMHFSEATQAEFLTIFNRHKHAIRHFPGCKKLQLMSDPRDPWCYTTLSHWDSPADLENYRTSELFEGVWKKVKPLFARRSEAFSLMDIETGTSDL